MKRNSIIEHSKINKKYRKTRLTIFTILVVVLLSMTVAYSANLSSVLTMIGNANIDVEEGNSEITSISNPSSVNATSTSYNYYIDSSSTDEMTVLVADFNVDFYRTGGSATTSITYKITVTNNSFSKMTLESIESSPTLSTGNITNYSYSINGVSEGTTVISPGETVTATVTLSLKNTSRNIHYQLHEILTFKFSKNSTNNLKLSPILETNQLTFNNMDEKKAINMLLINSGDTEITYTLSTTNANFQFVNDSGQKLTNLNIPAASQKNVTIYLEIADEHIFTTNSENLEITLTTTSPLILEYEVGSIQIFTPSGGAKQVLADKTIYNDSNIDFTAIQTTSGIFKNTVTGESTYFYRGNVNNNYVSFAGMTWRIIKIDKSGTKIILDSVLDTKSQWASSNTANNLTSAIQVLSYENSLIKPVLDNWYQENLSAYSDIIKIGKYCEDFTYQSLTSSGSGYTTYYFGSYVRNGPDSAGYTPEFNCPSEYTHEYNIGLISGDEITFAGGLFRSDNTEFYLYNPNISDYWWSLSPSYYDTTLRTMGILIMNGATGHFHDWQNGSTIANSNALRPVITLDTDRLSGGTGIVGDEYTFS